MKVDKACLQQAAYNSQLHWPEQRACLLYLRTAYTSLGLLIHMNQACLYYTIHIIFAPSQRLKPVRSVQ